MNAVELTIPRDPDRVIWIVTDEGLLVEVAWSADHKHYLGEDVWVRQDGESGSWGVDEIEAWSDHPEGLEPIAAAVREQVAAEVAAFQANPEKEH